MFQWLLGNAFGLEDRRRKLFSAACHVPDDCITFFSKMKDKVEAFEFKSGASEARQEIFLFRCPFKWKDNSLWIIGGDANDEMSSICCNPEIEGVFLVWLSDSGSLESQMLDGTIEHFLRMCTVRKSYEND